ncbi:MAG TPA: glycine--tRNA ligase [Ktedonobacter sp.]|jgi:glycyl-tRNA synthetase|nr:glycine--tRNA ligase [Ktedonobacter sp.]HAH01135.1 glycine--tRNA ligase [Ktedonobacter sp.]HAT46652.1 glycine--tRNA ligase [Ktedonobacter sp.]HBE24326.1 glycine--tRNA ligase [Ktedonobacter sp.]HBE28105.1 glycine--tRNA ligase [Ktedonobacter sp.]
MTQVENKQATNDTPFVPIEKIVALCKRRGFVYPNSEIYGGVAGIYDFGPLGVELRNNIRRFWWWSMVQMHDNVVGIEGAIITHPRVWEASGHVENFVDRLVDCKNCKRRFRIDHLPEENVIQNKCPNCGGELMEPRTFNLLMETYLGVVEGERMKTYLRGEASQNIYLDFDNVVKSSRMQIPFGICQIGKAFRNEVNPGNFLFRQREFEQWDLQFFVHPSEMQQWFDFWKEKRFEWYKGLINHKERLHFRAHGPDELAHYAKQAYDIEYKTILGWQEWEGIHWRQDWDLSRHSEYSGQDLSYVDQNTKERYIPWIVETSGGVDRTFLNLLIDAYEEEPDPTGKEARTVLRLHPTIAPVKVAVLPLQKNKEELVTTAKDIHKKLQRLMVSQYDDVANIGRRYRRQDEIGTPYCVTVDFQTLDDRTVTVRERDQMTQVRISIDELPLYLLERVTWH